MSFKDDIITKLTLRHYHDLRDLNIFQEQVKVADSYDQIVRILNEAKLTQRDAMKLLKNLTLNTIGQCNEDYIKYQEKLHKLKFQEDFK